MRALIACLVIVLGVSWAGPSVATAHTAPPHLRPALQAEALPAPPPLQVALKLDWTFYPRALPGKFRIYQPAGATNKLWAGESLPKGKALPLGREYNGGVVFVKPGEKILVTVVWRNPTNRDIRFYMEPHQVIPTNDQSTAWLTCMCMSLLYGAPPGGTWYRTIGVQLAPKTPPGSRLVAVHTVITEPAWLPPMPSQ